MEEKNTQLNNKNNLKTVRTYLSDMADTVRENEISVIKIALAEQNKNERENIYRQAEGTPLKKTLWIIGGLILIAVAIYGTYFVIQQKTKKDVPEQIITEGPIISFDEATSLDVTNIENLIEKINVARKELSTLNKSDAIKSISLSKDVSGVKEKLDIKEFFSGIEFTGPSSLVRSLSPSYMVGTYTKGANVDALTTNTNPRLFMIFQTENYEYAYAGMLEWEKTMAGDLFYLFELNTKENKLQLNERQWKDVIMNNKDVRILFNENNEPILYYVFVNKNNLVITDDPYAIKEITARLIIKNIKPL